jgi:hypothetical protein
MEEMMCLGVVDGIVVEIDGGRARRGWDSLIRVGSAGASGITFGLAAAVASVSGAIIPYMERWDIVGRSGRWD